MEPRTPRVGVAFSGGRDSTAMLHVTARAARGQGIEVVALHVNHRLSADADCWQSRAAATCRRWAKSGAPLRFVAKRLGAAPRPGESIEAWARQARYRALAEMARCEGIALVLLAHHRDDQAETFLLQALRGGGVAGLAAMPRSSVRNGVEWARPWLDFSRDEIDSYLRHHRLAFVDDDSNADRRFARNRLRLDLMPALTAAFPGAQTALGRAASRAQEAATALAELAELDLMTTAKADGLVFAPWSRLSAARRSNALRRWLQSTTGRAAPATLVGRLLDEWPAGGGQRQWLCAGGKLVDWRGVLRFEPQPSAAASATERPVQLSIVEPGNYPVAEWAGRLEVRGVGEGGIAWHRLVDLRLHRRVGGEQFQSGAGRPPRSLKKQFQAAGVSPARRDGPIVCDAAGLLYVAGLGIDARAVAAAGEPQAALRWMPDESAAAAE